MTRPPLAHAAVLAAALALAGCAADPVVAPTALPEGAPSGSLQGTQDVEAAAGGAAAKRGTITISLLMRPAGPADVAFTTDSRTLRPFTLDDDADPALDNAVTFRNVKPGTYAIQMANAPDGPLTAIRCTSTGGTDNNAVDVATRTATLSVEAGELLDTLRECRVIGDRIPAINSLGLVTGQLHGHRSGHAGLLEVPDGRTPQIVE